MKRRMVFGGWLFVVGLLLCVVLMFGFSFLAERGLNAVIGCVGILCMVNGSVIFLRSKFEGNLMEWSSLKSGVNYRIVFYCPEHGILCLATSPELFIESNRLLSFRTTYAYVARATHVRVLHLAKRTEVQFLVVEPEKISELGPISVEKK